MNEFFQLLKQFDLKGIFVTPTKNSFLQFFRYLFVGGIATVVDMGSLFALTEILSLDPKLSAAIAFVLGLAANYLLSKLLVFQANEARTNAVMEFLGYALIGLIGSVEEVIDSHVERVKKAYPAYFDTYDQMDELREYLNSIHNLYCVGRNGQHRYNNIDHSMCTSFETVKNILSGVTCKDNIWNVNTEKEYHEQKQEAKA